MLKTENFNWRFFLLSITENAGTIIQRTQIKAQEMLEN